MQAHPPQWVKGGEVPGAIHQRCPVRPLQTQSPVLITPRWGVCGCLPVPEPQDSPSGIPARKAEQHAEQHAGTLEKMLGALIQTVGHPHVVDAQEATPREGDSSHAPSRT